MTVADMLRADARDYRTRAVAAGDRGDEESALAFRIVAVALFEIADAVEAELAAAA